MTSSMTMCGFCGELKVKVSAAAVVTTAQLVVVSRRLRQVLVRVTSAR
ncbi:MAG: hypothetical protein BWY25_03287 [Chloroflexi bacterium ADurb.Bin222]|nr:MAG: hypothetical protein BWY25_03287 [Chloroflexi bacterium ADurb.Bin222]